MRVHVADERDRHAGDLLLGRADGLDGLGERQHDARWARRCRPSGRACCDSAVPAVPEPMLASSRSASSCRSERAVMVTSPFGSRSGGDTGRASGAGGVDRVAVDDQGDAGRRRARRRRTRRRCSATLGRQRAGDQLALADEPGDGEGQATVAGRGRSRRGRRPRAGGARRGRSRRRRSGRTPSRRTSIRRPATERTVWSARRSVRSTRSSGIANGWPPASTSSAAMIASVSGRRIWATVPLADLGGQRDLAAELADHRRARRPCRRRGRRCRS